MGNFNYELVFDLARAIKEGDTKTFKIDKKDYKLDVNQQQKVLNKSLQAFMYEPSEEVSKDKRIQAFSGSSDLPLITRDVFNVTNETPNFDLGWQRSYRGVNLTKGQLNWEIATVDTGIEFKLIPEGGKIEYADIAGEKVLAEVLKYGAGLGITWEIVEGRKLYAFVQKMEDARNKLQLLWADIHYGLLGAASLSNLITYQGVGSDPVLSRDIATLNLAAETCGDINKDKGFGDTANAQFLVYASPKLRTRLNQALRVTSAVLASTAGQGGDGTLPGAPGQIVDANIDPLYSYNAAIPTDKALFVLPGRKIQNAAYMKELSLSRMEQESLNELRTFWTAFGAIVADTDQVFELSFS